MLWYHWVLLLLLRYEGLERRHDCKLFLLNSWTLEEKKQGIISFSLSLHIVRLLKTSRRLLSKDSYLKCQMEKSKKNAFCLKQKGDYCSFCFGVFSRPHSCCAWLSSVLQFPSGDSFSYYIRSEMYFPLVNCMTECRLQTTSLLHGTRSASQHRAALLESGRCFSSYSRCPVSALTDIANISAILEMRWLSQKLSWFVKYDTGCLVWTRDPLIHSFAE